MKIYVGNISRTANEGDVRKLFEEFGSVTSCVIITDRYNGESKGFGFVEMENEEEAKAAMSALNSSMFQGKTLTVNQARPREERRPEKKEWSRDRDFGNRGNREFGSRDRDFSGGRRGPSSYQKDRW